jgi:hypothetical protein
LRTTLEAFHDAPISKGPNALRGDLMFRTQTMAALALALMSSAAFAQSAPPADAPDGPPAQLSGPAGDRDMPPPGDSQAENAPAQDPSHDMYCRRAAAASTGYVTPGEAANHEQAAGSVGGAVGGAALGAIIGGASHAAGAGALIGAGAGLIAGTAIGSSNARHAAADVQRAYSDAYYACMADNGGPPPPGGNAYGPPAGGYAYGPPPPGYYGPPPPYPYYYPYYYGPTVRFGVGFGPGWHRWR